MRSGHVQGLQVSEGLDGRLSVAVVWFLCTDVIKIITARETCVNQENESSWLCACATAHCTHMHFFPLILQETVRVIFKGFSFHFIQVPGEKNDTLKSTFLSRLSPELRRESSEILSGENKQWAIASWDWTEFLSRSWRSKTPTMLGASWSIQKSQVDIYIALQSLPQEEGLGPPP